MKGAVGVKVVVSGGGGGVGGVKLGHSVEQLYSSPVSVKASASYHKLIMSQL